MDLVALTETIIKKIVTDSESVSVKEFETEEENDVHLGVTILKNTAKRLAYRFDGESNYLEIEL